MADGVQGWTVRVVSRWVILTGVWVVLAPSPTGGEIALGAGLALAATLALVGAQHAAGVRFAVRPGWLRHLPGLGLRVLAGTGRVLAWRVVASVRPERAVARLRSQVLPADADEVSARTRCALTTAAVSATPPAFVVDVSRREGPGPALPVVLTVHELAVRR